MQRRPWRSIGSIKWKPITNEEENSDKDTLTTAYGDKAEVRHLKDPMKTIAATYDGGLRDAAKITEPPPVRSLYSQTISTK